MRNSTMTMKRESSSQGDITALLMRVGLALLYFLVTATLSLIVFKWVRETVSVSEMLPAFTLNQKGPSPNVEYAEGQSIPVWTGTDRITVLVLGIDEREQEEGPWRTDTMMVATLDPVTMQAGILSIPRDVWVEIPGYTSNRINTAHFIGDAYSYPGGGPALAMETVRHNLGIIPLDHYVRLNFNGFVSLLDQIGGIDLYVEETIDDPYYPDNNNGYDPFHLEAGQQHLDGETALKYARTRHSQNGDFDRARRQQQVIMAILEKITNAGMLPQLVAKAPELYATVADSVDTDFKLDQIIALAGLASKLDRDQIRFAVLDETCTESGETPDGAQVLIPIRDRIREKRDYVFGITAGDGSEALVSEAATVAIFNGTEQVGLAGYAMQSLTENGVSVTVYDNAEKQDYAASLIVLNRDKSITAKKIAELLSLPETAIVQGDGSMATMDYDIVVILGADYAPDIPIAPQ